MHLAHGLYQSEKKKDRLKCAISLSAPFARPHCMSHRSIKLFCRFNYRFIKDLGFRHLHAKRLPVIHRGTIKYLREENITVYTSRVFSIYMPKTIKSDLKILTANCGTRPIQQPERQRCAHMKLLFF